MPPENENKPDAQNTVEGQPATVPTTEPVVSVPLKLLTELQEGLARAEQNAEEANARVAGVEELMAQTTGADTIGEPKLRERKNFEPKFRTVKLRKYPIAGDVENMGFVTGWTNRGAYQEVDKSGVSPQIVDFIDIIFLGHERTEEGKLKAEKVRLLDLLNKGVPVNCKVLSVDREDKKVPTGEEIDVTLWDPQHGLVATGDKIDGYSAFSDISYMLEVPGHGSVKIDATYVN